MSAVHFAPDAPFSWPTPSAGPNMRVFHLGDGILCPASSNPNAECTDVPGEVTCKRCIRLIAIGRYDSDATVKEVLTRHLRLPTDSSGDAQPEGAKEKP